MYQEKMQNLAHPGLHLPLYRILQNMDIGSIMNLEDTSSLMRDTVSDYRKRYRKYGEEFDHFLAKGVSGAIVSITGSRAEGGPSAPSSGAVHPLSVILAGHSLVPLESVVKYVSQGARSWNLIKKETVKVAGLCCEPLRENVNVDHLSGEATGICICQCKMVQVVVFVATRERVLKWSQVVSSKLPILSATIAVDCGSTVVVALATEEPSSGELPVDLLKVCKQGIIIKKQAICSSDLSTLKLIERDGKITFLEWNGGGAHLSTFGGNLDCIGERQRFNIDYISENFPEGVLKGCNYIDGSSHLTFFVQLPRALKIQVSDLSGERVRTMDEPDLRYITLLDHGGCLCEDYDAEIPTSLGRSVELFGYFPTRTKSLLRECVKMGRGLEKWPLWPPYFEFY